MLAGEKKYFTYTKNRSGSNFIHNAPIISVIPCSAMQIIVCPVICFVISINEVHWNSWKSSQCTNWVVNAVIEFFRSIKLIQIHEIVLITGSITAELVQLEVEASFILNLTSSTEVLGDR